MKRDNDYLRLRTKCAAPQSVRVLPSSCPVGGIREVGYEVDIIGVGQESESGDAVVLRWGNYTANVMNSRSLLLMGLSRIWTRIS